MSTTKSVLRSTSLFLSLGLLFFIGAFTSSASSFSVPPSAHNTTLSALLHFKASISHDPYGAMSSWNTSSHFCTWQGIVCANSSSFQVKELLLPDSYLEGTLSPQIGNLHGLSLLDLPFNYFSGPVPTQLGNLAPSLAQLDLRSNQFSGALPYDLMNCSNLVFIDISNNELFGPLPSSLGQLKSLQTLDLSRNQLSGPLPSSIGQLKSLQTLDLSVNQLSGPLPSSLEQLKSLQILNLLGNPGLCVPLLMIRCTSHSERNMKLYILVSLCVVATVSLLAAFYAWWHFFKKRDSYGSDFVVPQYKAWTAEEMRVATNDFDATNVIGSGAVSMCYLGVMKVHEGMRVVAMKRLLAVDDYDGEDDEGRKSFVNEFKTLCKMRHRNLVKVLGYCVEGGEVALVMEYMERGDLDRHMHNEENNLSWEEKVNIALDVAEGLVYMHHEYEQPIIHCDLKPKNILLSSDMVAKISDFGIAKILEANETGDMSMSKLRGTFGYIAPEYGMGSRISTKVDVYSFGIVLLELVIGVSPTSPLLEEEVMSLRTWVETLHASGQIRQALRDYDLSIVQEVEELLRLGMQCTHDLAKKRPTMYIVRDSILQLKRQRLQNEHDLLPTTNHYPNNQQAPNDMFGNNSYNSS